jgi:hypothetical protein
MVSISVWMKALDSIADMVGAGAVDRSDLAQHLRQRPSITTDIPAPCSGNCVHEFNPVNLPVCKFDFRAVARWIKFYGDESQRLPGAGGVTESCGVDISEDAAVLVAVMDDERIDVATGEVHVATFEIDPINQTLLRRRFTARPVCVERVVWFVDMNELVASDTRNDFVRLSDPIPLHGPLRRSCQRCSSADNEFAVLPCRHVSQCVECASKTRACTVCKKGFVRLPRSCRQPAK